MSHKYQEIKPEQEQKCFLDDVTQEQSFSDLQKLSNLCVVLKDLRKEIAFYEEQLKDLKKKESQISNQEIPDFLLGMGLLSISLEDGSKVDINRKVYVSLPKKDLEKRKKVLKWIINNGGATIIKRVLTIEEPTIGELNLLKENHVIFEDKKDINGNTLKAWFSEKLGISKNSLQQIEISDVPKEAGLFIRKETKIKEI